MRALIIFFVATLVAMMSVAAGATSGGWFVSQDKPDVTVVYEISGHLTVTDNLDGDIETGSFVKAEGASITGILVTSKKNPFGMKCLLGGKREFYINAQDSCQLPNGQGQLVIRWGEDGPTVVLRTVKRDLDERDYFIYREQPKEPVAVPTTALPTPAPTRDVGIPDGEYLRLCWWGGFTKDGNPRVDPNHAVVWWSVEYPPISFSWLLYQWELWGEERSLYRADEQQKTTGTDEPSAVMATVEEGVPVILAEETRRLKIPGAGEVTLGFVEKGVSKIQAGDWPHIEVSMLEGGRPQQAILLRRGGEWEWLPLE